MKRVETDQYIMSPMRYFANKVVHDNFKIYAMNKKSMHYYFFMKFDEKYSLS